MLTAGGETPFETLSKHWQIIHWVRPDLVAPYNRDEQNTNPQHGKLWVNSISPLKHFSGIIKRLHVATRASVKMKIAEGPIEDQSEQIRIWTVVSFIAVFTQPMQECVSG